MWCKHRLYLIHFLLLFTAQPVAMYYLNAENQGADLIADDPHPLTMTGVQTYTSGPLGETNGAMQFSANISVTIVDFSDSDMVFQKSFTIIMQV